MTCVSPLTRIARRPSMRRLPLSSTFTTRAAICPDTRSVRSMAPLPSWDALPVSPKPNALSANSLSDLPLSAGLVIGFSWRASGSSALGNFVMAALRDVSLDVFVLPVRLEDDSSTMMMLTTSSTVRARWSAKRLPPGPLSRQSDCADTGGAPAASATRIRPPSHACVTACSPRLRRAPARGRRPRPCRAPRGARSRSPRGRCRRAARPRRLRPAR